MNKFRKHLKQIGMEKEFTEWMKKEPVQSKKFAVGRKVRVIDGKYHVTRAGSEGKIISNPGSGFIRVEFYKITNTEFEFSTPPSYSIRKAHLELIP